MRFRSWSFFALALAVFSNNAHADTLLVGTTLPGGPGDVAVTNEQYLDQPFTLTTAAQVAGISLQMTGFGTDPFTLWLTNATGPGTTLANVLLQRTLIFPSTGGGGVGSAILNVSTNLF